MDLCVVCTLHQRSLSDEETRDQRRLLVRHGKRSQRLIRTVCRLIYDLFRISQHRPFVSLPLVTVGADIMFSGCLSAAFVRSFVRTDLVITTSHERFEQSRSNLRQGLK